MSLYLDRLAQSMKLKKEREVPPPADTSSLGAAIEQLIDSAVEERVADALEKQRPAHNPRVPQHLREFTDKAESHEFPPPPPRTAPPRDLTVSLQRNEVGRVSRVSIGTVNFIALRDGEGKLIGMRQQED